MRQLAFTGLLIVDGQHIQPHDWPRGVSPQTQAINLIGLRFGRLTVLEKLSHGRWLCKCECDGTTEVQTKHLIRNHTTSCGCAQQEMYERRRIRKEKRCRS